LVLQEVQHTRVFIIAIKREKMTILAIFVDDGLACSNKKESLQQIINHLKKEFQIWTMDADQFLGLKIHRDRQKKELAVTQPQFFLALLKKFRMESCNPKLIPADPHTQLSSSMSQKNREKE
jgi:Zn-dependent M16 (insulinase) family peptidase